MNHKVTDDKKIVVKGKEKFELKNFEGYYQDRLYLSIFI